MGKKQLYLVVLVFSLMFALAAGTALAASGAKPPAAGPNTLTVAMNGEPPTLDPVAHTAQVADIMNHLNFSKLFYSVNSDLYPDLCTSYENLSETEWVFKLRRDAKFHNGAPLRAEDVVASLERAKANPRVNRYSKNFKVIEALDDYTVKITTDGPYSEILFDLIHSSNSILPKALIDAKHDFGKNPVGSGPFMFKSWVLGDRLVMERFDGFYDQDRKAKVQTLIFKIIPEGSARSIALEVGEIDAIHHVEAMDIERLKANPGIKVDEKPTFYMVGININSEKPGLGNVLVRKALNAAVDRELIIQGALNGKGTPRYAQMPSMPGSSEEGQITYNLEQAKKYMAESGVDPASLDITILCSSEHWRRAAEVVQADWAEIGVNAKIESIEIAALLSRSQRGEIDAAVNGFGTRSLLAWINSMHGAASIGGMNSSRTNNPAIEAQLAVCFATMDPAKRITELAKLSKIINEVAPRVPLYQDIGFKAFNANLNGLKMDGVGTVEYNRAVWAK